MNFVRSNKITESLGVGLKTKIEEFFEANYNQEILSRPKYTVDENFNVLVKAAQMYIECKNHPLPDNMTVNGNLHMAHYELPLPSGLRVNGDLTISNSEIKEFPDDMSIVGNIHMRNTSINRIPTNIFVGGIIKAYPTDFRNEGIFEDENVTVKFWDNTTFKIMN